MNYKYYLELVTQLLAHGVAQLYMGDNTLNVRWDAKTKKCLIKTQVFTSIGPIPPFITDILSTRGSFKWSQENISLKMSEDGHIELIQEIEAVFKFTYLRSVMRDFLREVHVWKNFFHMHAAKANFLYS